MSTYVISDIHGYYEVFQAMLEKIDFKEHDLLILAGDYLDRGSQNIEMMKWLENKPENVIALKGNHDMEFVENISIMDSLAKKAGIDIEHDLDQAGQLVWYKECKKQLTEAGFGYFDYYGTLGNLLQLDKVSFSALKKCALFFETLPYTYEININGRRCIAVHAGYTDSLDNLQKETDYESLEEFYLQARDDAYLYGGVEHGMIIAGHTPTLMPEEVAFNDGKVYRFYDDVMDCIFYDIDCGCSYMTANSNLACIRLEDEQVFYVNTEEYYKSVETVGNPEDLPAGIDEG